MRLVLAPIPLPACRPAGVLGGVADFCVLGGVEDFCALGGLLEAPLGGACRTRVCLMGSVRGGVPLLARAEAVADAGFFVVTTVSFRPLGRVRVTTFE